MWGLLLLGVSLALALATTAARPKKRPVKEPVEIIIEPPPPRDPPKKKPPVVGPIEAPSIPNIGESQVLRVFVLDTTDKPVSSLGRTVIERNYREAVNWVSQEMGAGIIIRYYHIVRYIHLPYTSAEILNMVLTTGGPYPRPKESGTDSWVFFHFITDWMKENTEWDAYSGDATDEAWIFMVRGAGGFAGGTTPTGNRPGLAIVGDAVLSAWLGDAGLEVNDAYKYVFLEDCNKYPEWAIGYNGIPCTSESTRRSYTTRNAQIGSFIHEGFHAMFALYHLGNLEQFQKEEYDEDGNIVMVSDAPSNIMDNWQDYPFPESGRVNEDGIYEEPIHAIVRADALESFFV